MDLSVLLALDSRQFEDGLKAASEALAAFKAGADASFEAVGRAQAAIDEAAEAAKNAEDAFRDAGENGAEAMREVGDEAGRAAEAIDRKLSGAIKGAAMQAGRLAIDLGGAWLRHEGNDAAADYLGGIGGGALQGAGAGFALGGPWGTLVGGLLGGAAGGVTTWLDRDTAEKQREAAEKAAAEAAERLAAAEAEAAEEARRAAEAAEQERRGRIEAAAAFDAYAGERDISRADERGLERMIQRWEDAAADIRKQYELGMVDDETAIARNDLYTGLAAKAAERIAGFRREASEEAGEGAGAARETARRGSRLSVAADALQRVGGEAGGARANPVPQKLDLLTRILNESREYMRRVAEQTKSPIATFA